jgi:hypothetical protein
VQGGLALTKKANNKQTSGKQFFGETGGQRKSLDEINNSIEVPKK